MLTIGICDDNIRFASFLQDKLDHLCFSLPEHLEYKIYCFHTAHEVLSFAKKNPVHILFLDIEMPETNGFELANQLQALHLNTLLIFVSSHDSFVYQSFRYQPFRFLRKDYLDEELPVAFQDAVHTYLTENNVYVFRTTIGKQNLSLKNILYIESQKNYIRIHCFNNQYTCRSTLTEISTTLSQHNFIRIHAGYLINLQNVKNLEQNHVVLVSDIKLPISKKYLTAFKNKYAIFLQRRELYGFHSI
jgi:DNA-binding LytR/AlgR family response regulator